MSTNSSFLSGKDATNGSADMVGEIAGKKSATKRTRLSSGSSSISNSDILIAIRAAEERIVSEMHSLLESRIAEVRSEFDEKLSALSSSIDNRIQAAMSVTNVTSNSITYEGTVTTIDAIAAASNQRMESLERLHLLHDVIINGIPFVDNEDTFSYFRSICDVISFRSGERAVSSVFRLPTKPTSANASSSTAGVARGSRVSAPPIIVKFLNSDYSRQFISCYLKLKNLNLTHIGFSTPTRIFINENLTKNNRELFRYCLQLKHRHKLILLHLFTRLGIVHVKFAGLDKPVLIQSKEEIDNYITRFSV